jgi:hypothetical protein
LPAKDQPARIKRDSSGRNKNSRAPLGAKPGILLADIEILSQ